MSGLRKAIDKRNTLYTRHKVTDFSILHIEWSDIQSESKQTTSVRIHAIYVPVIVEVKYNRNFYQDHSAQSMMQSRLLQMNRAKASILPQVGFLFSRGGQNSVIAIAVAGSFWCWREFKQDDVQISKTSQKMEVKEMGNRRSFWSNEFRLKSVASNAEFQKIEEWVERFISEPKRKRL